MSAPGRWLRLDVGCFESEWLAPLSTGAQHAWTRLLLYTKGNGTAGSVKRLGPIAAETLWRIPPVSLHEMETAAIADGALRVEDGWWVVTGWAKYQQPDHTNAIRKQRLRDKRKMQDTGGIHRSTPGTCHATETETETETEKETPKPALVHGVKNGKRWSVCPADWEPSQKHRDLADSLRVNFEPQLTAFREWEFRSPKLNADLAFNRWLRTAGASDSKNGNGKATSYFPLNTDPSFQP